VVRACDALRAKSRRLAEHDRAVRFDQTLKLGAPHFERELANVLPIDVPKIERREGRALAARRPQRREVAVSIGTEHNRLAIDQRAFDGQ
jgi:hypothetical protein